MQPTPEQQEFNQVDPPCGKCHGVEQYQFQEREVSFFQRNYTRRFILVSECFQLLIPHKYFRRCCQSQGCTKISGGMDGAMPPALKTC